jgi:hypothetical protein
MYGGELTGTDGQVKTTYSYGHDRGLVVEVDIDTTLGANARLPVCAGLERSALGGFAELGDAYIECVVVALALGGSIGADTTSSDSLLAWKAMLSTYGFTFYKPDPACRSDTLRQVSQYSIIKRPIYYTLDSVAPS